MAPSESHASSQVAKGTGSGTGLWDSGSGAWQVLAPLDLDAGLQKEYDSCLSPERARGKLIVKLQSSCGSESFDKPCMDRIVNHLPVVLYGAYFMI